MQKNWKTFIFICLLTYVCALIALPEQFTFNKSFFGREINWTFDRPMVDLPIFGLRIHNKFELKRGLDIQGGMQVVLKAQMDEIAPEDRDTALESAREIIQRRVDLYGISEPLVQTSKVDDEYRILVELPGISDQEQALELVGQTAQLDFRFQSSQAAQLLAQEATPSAFTFLSSFTPTQLTGNQLKRSVVQFDQQTNDPVISLEFNDEGRDIFAEITSDHVGDILAIFIDGYPIATPRISTAILDGRAIMTGDFTLDGAKQLAVQLNAGALPVSIEVIEQKAIGASLGEASVAKSIRAGMIGLWLVMLFMILYYGFQGFLASCALFVYALITIAIYKVIGVTLTLPGLAGLLLSVGMAVDANILIFERMKEELRIGQGVDRAIELGFGRAWDSIKDANLATIFTSLVLINPMDFSFLNRSGMIKGFGITLLIGVLVSLFTGVVVTRTLVRISQPIIKSFLKSPDNETT